MNSSEVSSQRSSEVLSSLVVRKITNTVSMKTYGESPKETDTSSFKFDAENK